MGDDLQQFEQVECEDYAIRSQDHEGEHGVGDIPRSRRH